MKQIAHREPSDWYAITPERQVGGQCLITQWRLPYDSIVPRPCAMDDALGSSEGVRMALDDVCLTCPLRTDPPRAWCLHVSAEPERDSASSCKRPCITSRSIRRVTETRGSHEGSLFPLATTLEYPVCSWSGRCTWVSWHPPSSGRRGTLLRPVPSEDQFHTAINFEESSRRKSCVVY